MERGTDRRLTRGVLSLQRGDGEPKRRRPRSVHGWRDVPAGSEKAGKHDPTIAAHISECHAAHVRSSQDTPLLFRLSPRLLSWGACEPMVSMQPALA